MWDLLVHSRKVNATLVILNVSVDYVVVCTKLIINRKALMDDLKRCFTFIQKESAAIKNVNCRIIQSKSFIFMDQRCNLI